MSTNAMRQHGGGVGAGLRTFDGSVVRPIPTRFARRIAALRALSPEERHALGTAFAPATVVPPGTDLMVEGDSLTYGYIVEEGWACGYRLLNDGRRQILNFVLPGDCIGVSAAVIRTADHSACTLTPCRVIPFSAPRLAELQRGCPQLGEAFAWSTRLELAMLQERLVNLGRRTARERVAHLILELLHRLRLVGLADGTAFELPLTQGALGDALGLSIVHVNRTLRRLNNEGLIRYRPGVVAAIDLPALARIAEFDAEYLHQTGFPRAANVTAAG
jgi:CRP-like cAMP-binding protein